MPGPQAIGEELYEEIANEGAADDYDQSELVNLVAHPLPTTPELLKQMRTLLVEGFPQPPPH